MDNYELREIVAVQWNPVLAEQFPNAEHRNCRQAMRANHDTNMWEPYDPPRCVDYHCHKCGNPCNVMGHHTCLNS